MSTPPATSLIRAEIHAELSSHHRPALAILRHDDFVGDQIERALTHAGIPTREEPGPPDRTIEASPPTRDPIRCRHRCEAPSRPERVEAEIARRELEPEVARRRVIEVHAEHHEWRGVGLLPGANQQPFLPGGPTICQVIP